MAEAPAGAQPPRPNNGAGEKKESPPSAWTLEAILLVGVLIIAFLSQASTNEWLRRFNEGQLDLSTITTRITSLIPEWVITAGKQFAVIYITFATVLSLFFLLGIVYSLIRWRQYAIVWQDQLYPNPDDLSKSELKNPKWQRVQEHINSDNPSDWRLAILEADIILDELLDSLGYIGDTIGDKLKKANKGDFVTLNDAWEAHKIRNAIAHQGSDFILTQREALRIINLYRVVFEEFDYI
jgi:hypothetical protein